MSALARRWIRLKELSRLVSEFAAAHVVVQALGVLSGLLIVNVLPVSEYALYTLALSVVTFLAIFSDLGLSSALLFFRRETRRLQTSFAPYLEAALRMRRGLLMFGTFFAVAFIYAVGGDRGFGSLELLAICILVIASDWFQVSGSVSLVALRLDAQYRASYLAEGAGNAVRLAGVGLMIFASAYFAWIAMLPGLAGALVTNVVADRGRKISAGDGKPMTGKPGPDQYRDLRRYILPTSVSAAYYSMQGPLVVWLSALFSQTETIAEVGALSRLGMIMGLVAGFAGNVFFPRLSWVTNDKLYLRRYLQFWVILVLFSLIICGSAMMFPTWFLWLLGGSYSGLHGEFLLVTYAAILSTWGGYVVSVNNARGWVRPQPALVVVYAAIQVVLVVTLDLRSTAGVLTFGLLSSVFGMVLHSGVTVIGFVRPEWVLVATGERHNAE